MVTGSSALTGSDALTGSESKCDDALTGGITTMRSDALTGGTPAPTGGTTNTATGSSVADNRGRAAIFDLDGTLLDSMGVWDQIDAEFLAKRGIAVPDDYMAKVSAMQFRQIAEYTIARFGLDDTPQALVEEWNGMAKRMYAHVVEPKPHAVAYLRELKESGAKLAVATTMLPDLRAPALAHAGMADLFDAVVGVDDAAGRGKEHPDVYLLAADTVGVDPAHCTVFEDLFVGMRSAKRAGMQVWGVHDDSSDHDWGRICALADGVLFDFADAPRSLR